MVVIPDVVGILLNGDTEGLFSKLNKRVNLFEHNISTDKKLFPRISQI